ncbi:MAG TPA: transposase [Nitrospiria bacterium]|nr:transposase [Nitrospiria bacterium]
MRNRRIIGSGPSYYHCVSRIIERKFILGEAEKAYFMDTLRRLERFSGVRVLTHCLMDNHFHLLLMVEDQPKSLSEKEILRRVGALYGEEKAAEIAQRFKQARQEGSPARLDQEKQAFLDRMHDLSVFMKELKQRFTQWHNRRNDRRGPLWEDRFKSLLVEGSHQALLTVASYIALNPVRAGICHDPKDFRWCGYGAATGGCPDARNGIRQALSGFQQPGDWASAAPRYRRLLFGAGSANSIQKGFDPAQVRKVLEEDGKLGRSELLRCRIRYFTYGLALGSKIFIEDVFDRHRDHFGQKRTQGCRRMKGGDWGGDLFTMRDLRQEAISVHG